MIFSVKSILTCATALASLAAVSTACTDDDANETEDAGCPAGCPAPAGDAQTPPQGSSDAILAWLEAGSYKGAGWTCEAAAHPGRGNSPHGANRICNNTLLTTTAAPADYPFGAASVKELFAADNTTVVGYATGLKLEDGPSNGSKWYWFVMNGATMFNGKGMANNADVCSGCHVGAGTTGDGRDFVFTQVP